MNAPTPIAASRWYSAAAILFGIVTTYAILQYSLNNLDILGLAPDVKKVRSLEIYIFVFGHVFIFFILGKLAYSHPEWAFKLSVLGIAIALFDFAGTYQARLGIFQQQTLTQTAQKSHADLIASQIGVNQNAAKELSDSAARQRANKLITGSAQTAMNAGKQAEAGNKLVAEHAAAIKEIRPTEADTWGEWASTKVFLGAVLLHVFNLMMWGVAGALSGGKKPSIEGQPERTDSATPQIDLEAAREAVKVANAPKPSPAPSVKWLTPMLTVPAMTMPAPAPAAPMPEVLQHTEIGTAGVAKSVRKQYTKAAGRQMDTGTTGKASVRYERVKMLVEGRTVKPSINALYRIPDEHISKDTAKDYIEAMERDGIVRKHGKGWVLA
jgi:hypothetical protein